MSIQNYIFGIDIDNTLTGEKLCFASMSLEETKRKIIDVHPKKGIEILSILGLNIVLITGRGSYYYDETVHWLKKQDVPFVKLVMVDKDKYNRRITFEEYVQYKLDAYLENNVHFCLEDDDMIIDAVRKYGIKAVKVGDDFKKSLYDLFK